MRPSTPPKKWPSQPRRISAKIRQQMFRPMKTPPPSSSPVRGFSLIELLAVMGIIALIVGFTIPAVTTMMRGSQLTQGSQLLGDQIALARQLALSENRSIEV